MRLEGVGEALIILFCFWVLPWVWPLGQQLVQKIKQRRLDKHG